MNTEEIEALLNYKGPDEVVHFTDYLLEKASSNSKVTRFESGYPLFEKMMGGIETGEVVVVTGNKKNGKTTFAESWLRSIMLNNPSAGTAIFSYEVQTEKLLVKYMKDEKLPIYVPKTLKTVDFEWLKKKCAEAKYKFNTRIIFIDHLHFQVDMNTRQNMSLNIGAFMRRLKHEIAIGLNLCVVLIAHQGQPKENQEASADLIRDSSFVAQEADAVVVVSRMENLDESDLVDYKTKFGDEIADRLRADPYSEDKFSANLALVKIACHRRTGVYEWKKLFQKRGEFMEEV